jgi:hypothetical protein
MKFESYKNWLNEEESMKFINSELDYSELFRLFNHFNDVLPKNMDKSIFDKNKYYAELISKDENKALQEKFNIANAMNIKDKIDKKWHPLVDYIYKIYKNGVKKEVDLNFLNNVYFGEDQKSNEQSFHNFIKNPKYFETLDKNSDLYKDYYKDSFEWFDKNPDKIPVPVILQLKDRYFLVGGNRRICWLISKGIKKMPIWLIKA